MKLAFAGFRHDHILGLYKLAREHPGVQVVAASEADPQRRGELAQQGAVQITHADYREMLAGVECDAVAVGDCYGNRGAILIAALAAGRQVLADKPLCTRLGELDQVAELAKSKGLSVGCMLDLRSSPVFRAMRRLIREGAIGEVHTVTFTGQHPLLLGKRPQWYFEKGLHGGTINDIAIHGLDAVGWLTARRVEAVVAARAWNARLKQVPHFQDGAQIMLRLDNGGGVLADVSYLAPDGCGYKAPQYWRITCHGDGGVVEATLADGAVLLARKDDTDFRRVSPLEQDEKPNAYFQAFLDEVAGRRDGLELTTAEVLASSRIALTAQLAADEGKFNVPVG
jgi:predicted dehydrogenase